VGIYKTDTTDEQFDFKQVELATESGILVLKAVITSKNGVDPDANVTYALQMISDHEAVVAGIGNGEGGTVRAIDSSNNTELDYSGFRFVSTGNR
jgi:hypothetical protein